MSKEMASAIKQDAHIERGVFERLIATDIAGIPLPLIACALLAVAFGSLVAMTAGGH
jgi:hypothetical protein